MDTSNDRHIEQLNIFVKKKKNKKIDNETGILINIEKKF